MPQLTVQQVSRSFGAVKALRAVDLTVRAGEVHALMGENGAGKSTLIRLLAGVDVPDEGQILLDGSPRPPGQPAVMQAAGLRFIHQELHPVRGLSVAENMFLDHPYPTRFGLVDWGTLHKQARAALARLGLDHIDVKAAMTALGAGDQMLVRIAATLIVAEEGRAPWLYVMDEPTAALTGAESERLFAVIETLVAEGSGVLYVSHRMPEVLRLSHRVSVLRDGAHISTLPIDETGQERIIHDMTGRDLTGLFPARAKPLDAAAEPVFKVDDLRTDSLVDVSFSLRPGEILGIAGLAGSGRGELMRAVLGDLPRTSGQLSLAGEPLASRPADVWAQGVAYIPRERRSEGLMVGRSIQENAVLPHLSSFARGKLFLNRLREKQVTQTQGERVRLKHSSIDQPCKELSGGNQQKVLFARALAGNPKLLMLDEPTRGVDIGARFDLYRIIRTLSDDGLAVLVTSSDLPELIGLSDRIAILSAGALGTPFPADGLSEGDLLSRVYAAEQRGIAA